jgi:hypothetical protein
MIPFGRKNSSRKAQQGFLKLRKDLSGAGVLSKMSGRQNFGSRVGISFSLHITRSAVKQSILVLPLPWTANRWRFTTFAFTTGPWPMNKWCWKQIKYPASQLIWGYPLINHGHSAGVPRGQHVIWVDGESLKLECALDPVPIRGAPLSMLWFINKSSGTFETTTNRWVFALSVPSRASDPNTSSNY